MVPAESALTQDSVAKIAVSRLELESMQEQRQLSSPDKLLIMSTNLSTWNI